MNLDGWCVDIVKVTTHFLELEKEKKNHLSTPEIVFDLFKLRLFIAFDFRNYVYEEQNNIDIHLMG